MTDPFGWSLTLGRWFATTIRVHLIFVCFAAVKLLGAARLGSAAAMATAAWLGLLILVVVLHELGHAAAAVRMGSDPEDVNLWPLGNLARPRPPAPTAVGPDAAVIASAGLVTSLLLAIVPAISLRFVGASFVWNPFGNGVGSSGAPLLAHGVQAQPLSTVWCVGWFGWLNWVVFLLNLIPAAPMDGGRIFRAQFGPSAWASAAVGYRRDHLVALFAGRGIAIILVIVGFIRIASEQSGQGVLLIALAVLIEYFIRYEARMFEEGGFLDDDVFGYDFSEGYTSLESSVAKTRPKRESAIERWRRRRSELRRRRRMAKEAAEEEHMDEILAKLHRDGPQALSDEETRFLRRVSAKYRNRSRTQ